MSRPATPTPSPGALRMRQLHQRRAKGLQRLPQPWDWITAAQAIDLVTKAFRAASWECRHLEATPEDFAEALIQDFEVLIAAAAARAGHPIYTDSDPAFADRMLAQVPEYWRHQYPRFGIPVAEQVDQAQAVDRASPSLVTKPAKARRAPKPKLTREVVPESRPPVAVEIRPDLAAAWMFSGQSNAQAADQAEGLNGTEHA